jgi:hypothetical protein
LVVCLIPFVLLLAIPLVAQGSEKLEIYRYVSQERQGDVRDFGSSLQFTGSEVTSRVLTLSGGFQETTLYWRVVDLDYASTHYESREWQPKRGLLLTLVRPSDSKYFYGGKKPLRLLRRRMRVGKTYKSRGTYWVGDSEQGTGFLPKVKAKLKAFVRVDSASASCPWGTYDDCIRMNASIFITCKKLPDAEGVHTIERTMSESFGTVALVRDLQGGVIFTGNIRGECYNCP